MATGIEDIKRTNQFIKSSTDDYQDPVFLTFAVRFFPEKKQYPKGDGLSNSALLRELESEVSQINSNIFSHIGNNDLVEFSALHWLNDYYPTDMTDGENPARSLAIFHDKLKQVESSPWYFQSIQGIGDLWKSAYRVKEGTKPATLTFNCIDSIEQPLTEMAEHYMFAVYDQQRLSYRLPDNLRWFDMEIFLFEIRDVADYSGQFFQIDGTGKLQKGLRVLKFECKMCEFDFSNFLGGAQSDHKIYMEDKSFSPTFDVKVGWVEQKKLPLSEAHDYRHIGMFSGVLDTLNNRLSRFIQNATRLPAGIVGSVLNEIQTFVEVKTMGNVYTGANRFLNEMNNIPGNITGRNPIVGPPIISNVGEDVYPNVDGVVGVSNIGTAYQQPINPDKITEIGDLYPSNPNPPAVTNIGDLYKDVPSVEVNTIGDVYKDVPGVEVNTIGDVYEDVPNVEINTIGETYEPEPDQEVSDMDDIYLDVPQVSVNNMGDIYQDVPNTSVSDIGDVYPDEPPAPSVSDMGDLYQDQPTQPVDTIGDIYPDIAAPDAVKDMGDLYQNIGPEEVKEIGDIYDELDKINVDVIGDVYQQEERNQEVDDMGDIYVEEAPIKKIDGMGDVYPEDLINSEKVDDIGDIYR